MVFFSCEGCNETLKKNQVEGHTYKCSDCWAVSCVDCSKVFKGDEYKQVSPCCGGDQPPTMANSNVINLNICLIIWT